MVLVLLHAAGLLYQLQQHHYLFPDSDRYLAEAANITRHGEFYASPLTEPIRAQEYTIRTPAYPLLLAALGTPQGYVVWMLLAQNLLSLLNLAAVARLAARYTPPRWGWWLALVVTFPAQLIYANVLMSEMLLQTAVVGLCSSGFAFWQTRRWPQLAGVAAWATAAMLIKPVFYPFCLVVLLAGLYAAWQQRRVALAAVAAVPLVLALLYQGWNWQRTGYFHFSSIAEINLLRYNVRGALRKAEGPEVAERVVLGIIRAAENQLGFAAQQRYIKEQSLAVLREHPVAYGVLHAQGMANFFLDPGRFDVVHFLAVPEPPGQGLLARFNAEGYAAIWHFLRTAPVGLLALLLAVAVANLVRLGAFLAFLTSSAAPRTLRITAGALVFYVAFLTGPLGAARFAVPVFPLLLLAVPFALDRCKSLRLR
ncbi:hypothetical protein [Hymenobacter busanensis]|nr:hypothetical protein [Hymenobacter busanensis]QHJ07708.1 hypothetical protein GUY19_10580 [Hymenobacter busanensis]